MRKKILVLSALALAVAGAWADAPGNGNANGLEKDLNLFINSGSANANANNNANRNANRNSNSNRNENRNSNRNSNANNNTNTATGGNATGGNAGAVAAAVALGGGGGGGGGGGAGGAGGNATGGSVVTGAVTQGDVKSDNRSSVGDVTVVGDTYRRAAASAMAAPLTVSNGTCMGSTSGGAQGVGFGVSIGHTWTDAGCDRRYNAQMLDALGVRVAALALMCQDVSVREAMEVAGIPCKVGRAVGSEVVAIQPQYTDPLVRKRLGLPPLE